MRKTGKSGQTLAWILVSDKGGDNAQMRVLAAALGLQVVEIPLQFNRLYKRPNLWLGATTRTLTDAARARLQPPWPDVVISSGRRSVPVARWIRAQAGGAPKLVHVGRPWGKLSWFDIVLAMPQYGLRARENVFHPRMPFNAHDPAALAAVADRWRSRFEAYPRPWIGLLVGGTSRPFVLDEAAAAGIGAKVSRRARETGGSVFIVTSRRTPTGAADTLFAAIDAPGLRYRWSVGDADNPYVAVLALADELIVTGDSASMLAEAVRTRRPVAIAELTYRPGRRYRRVRMAQRLLPRPVFDLLVDYGLVTRTRDLGRLHQRLVAEGLATILNGHPVSPREFVDDLEEVLIRVKRLLEPEWDAGRVAGTGP